MNNDRRDCIKAAAKGLAEAAAIIQEQRALIDQTKDEEQEILDAMPEGLKNGDRGQDAEAAIGQLSEAVDRLDAIDFAEIGQMLAEAIDRDVADLPEAAMDEAAVLARRYNRLPRWARVEIERLKAEVASALEQAQAVYPDPEGDEQFTIADWNSPHKGKALPFDQIELRGIVVYTEGGVEGVALRSNKGRLVVYPHVSNQIVVAVEPRSR